MRQHLKTMQERKKHLAMLLFLAPRLNTRAFANNKASSDTTSSRLNLQHEPIQPIPPAEGLDPAKVTLSEALFHDPRLGRDNNYSAPVATCYTTMTPITDSTHWKKTVSNSRSTHQQYSTAASTINYSDMATP